MSYRVLVIDNNFEGRKKYYNELINEDVGNQLTLVHPFNADDLEIIKEKSLTANIALVDIYLDDDSLKPFLLNGKDVIELIQEENKNIPIYLISDKWDRNAFGIYKDYFLRDKIVGGATIKQLESIGERSKIRLDIKKAIIKNTNNIALDISPNDDLNILHLSDLQFGGDWEKIGKNTDNPYDCVIDDIIASIPLKDDGNRVDTHIIVITGDISQTGSPEEFLDAYKYLSGLCDELRIEKTSRFIVPGNHDISLPLCASSKVKVNLKGKKKLSFTEDKKVMNTYGLAPFNDFAISFTGRDDWSLDYSKSEKELHRNSFISTVFRNYGINIIGLNSVINLNIEQPKSPSIDNKFISEINNNLKNLYEFDNEIINFYLIHHKPWPDTDDSLKEDGEELLRKLSQYNDAFVLCGHRHEGCSNRQPFSSKTKECFLYSISPTPSLIDRKPNTLRGFNYISLKREKDKIKEVEITTFNHAGGVKFDLKIKEEFIRKNNSWSFKSD